MTRSTILLYFSIATAVITLMAGLILNNDLLLSIIPLVIGIFWVVSQPKEWRWAPSVSVGCLLVLGSISRGMGEFWLATCVIGSLIAWDLSHFLWDIQLEDSKDQEIAIERGHLNRLFLVVGVSILLLGIATVVKLSLSFGWILVLGLLLILGFGRSIIMLRE